MMAKRVGEPEATFEAENKKQKVTQQTLDDLMIMSGNVSDSEKSKEEINHLALSSALCFGRTTSSSVTMYIVGQPHSGKTYFVASLLGDKFEEQMATQNIDADICKIASLSKWCSIKRSKLPITLQKMYYSRTKNVSAVLKQAAAQNRQQLEYLPKVPAAVEAVMKQAKAAAEDDEDEDNVVIIQDLAGQSFYYGLHSIFLKEDNVAMIVFDASQPLQDPVKGRDSQKDPYTQKSISPAYTGVESVCYWLQSIHVIRKDGVNQGAASIFVPTIFLVATHIDLIGDSKAIQERKKEIIDQLVLLLEDKPFAKHIPGVENGLREALEKCCFFISNKISNVEELDRLKSMLTGAFCNKLRLYCPVMYLNIEETLLSLNKAAISTEEFHAIAYKNGIFVDLESTEIKDVLAHFHLKGSILHFPQVESLKEVVVLSPNWLNTLISYMIFTDPYTVEIDCSLQFKQLTNHGILVEDFIAFMVNKFNEEQGGFGLPLSTEQAMEFAKLFGFIVELNNDIYFLEESIQPPFDCKKNFFIAPSLLPLEFPIHVELADDRDHRNRIVYFRFVEGFISPMVFRQVVSACIRRNIDYQQHICWIRRHMLKMVLGHDQLYYVSLCEDQASIRLSITPDDDGVITHKGLQDRWNLIEELNDRLIEFVKAFMPSSALPQRYIPCCFCSNLHLNLDVIRNTDHRLHCIHGKLPKDYYGDLRQYQDVLGPIGIKITGTLTADTVIPSGKSRSGIPSERDMRTQNIRQYAIEWESLALELGIRHYVINEISEKYKHFPRKLKMCLVAMLEHWLKFFPSPTWGILEDAVSKIRSTRMSSINQTSGLLMQRDLEQMVLTTKEDIDLPLGIKDRVLQSVEVLLVTLSVNETLAAHYYLQPLNGHKNIYRFLVEGEMRTKFVLYYIGRYGTCPTAIRDVQPDYEINDRGSSVSVMADKAFPNLGVIINVGIACGIKSKVELFDVLVSSKIVNYVKAKDGKYLPEGNEIKLSSKLTRLFTQFNEWPIDVIKNRLNDTGIKLPHVKIGTILSGDDPTKVEALIKTVDSVPIGIDKQKTKLFLEAQQTTINTLIIKAVYDVGNAKKSSEEYQPTAALLAANFVHKCLCDPEAHEVIKGIILLRNMLKQAKNEGLTIKVKHAKILFCGASSAGKTSFCRLLKGEEHKTVYKSTPPGHSQQVLLSGEKINVLGSTWISLNTQLEIKELIKKLIARLQKQEDEISDTSIPLTISDSIEKSLPVADSKLAIDTAQTDNQIDTAAAATDTNTDNASNLESKNFQQTMGVVSIGIVGAAAMVYNSVKMQKNKHMQYIQIEKQIVAYDDEFDTKDIPKTWNLFTFLDTGGQPEFINMLPAINACTAITFIVLNMSSGKKCLNDPVISQYKHEGFNYRNITLKYTNLHLLKCLLSSVKVAAMNKDYFQPQIIEQVAEDEQKKPAVGIIGTCADILKKEFKEKYTEEFSEINKEVKKLVKTLKKGDVLDIWCDGVGNFVIPVNNAIPRSPQKEDDNEDQTSGMQTSCLQVTTENIQKIRDSSNEILEQKSQYEIPISWFLLELELRSYSKDCIHLDDVFAICYALIPKMTNKEIIEVLNFFHFNGMLLYFDKVSGMNEFVITNPQWLFLNLTEIIMCKYKINANKIYGSYYIEEIQQGICHTGLLENLNLDLQGIKLQSFVNLLEYLKIIAPMDDGYFMPTVLPPCDETYIFTEKEFGLPAAYTYGGLCIFPEVKPLLIECTFGTIPRGLFGFLIVQLLQNKSNKLLNQLYGCNDDVQRRFVDLICFYIRPFCYVSLRDKISYLEIQVRVKNKERSYHYEVQSVITEALKQVCEKFNWQFSDCRYGFLCEEHSNSSQDEHLTLLSSSQPFPDEIPRYTFCGNDSQQATPIEEFHRIWFEDLEEVTKKVGYREKENLDYSTALKNIQDNYCEIINLSIDSMLGKLFSKDVITIGQKKQIKACDAIESERMAYFLDNIIIPSLKSKNIIKFKGLLETMKESGDCTLISMAKKLA